MPIYEYRCEQGHTFDVMQRMSDAPVASCETCSAPVERVFRPPAVHFKGSGFYNTDYGTRKRQRERGEGAEGAAGQGEGSSSEPAAGSEKKSDAPAKSTETAGTESKKSEKSEPKKASPAKAA